MSRLSKYILKRCAFLRQQKTVDKYSDYVLISAVYFQMYHNLKQFKGKGQITKKKKTMLKEINYNVNGRYQAARMWVFIVKSVVS